MANQLFMQATMELVNKGEYVSWKLPKNTQIVLEKFWVFLGSFVLWIKSYKGYKFLRLGTESRELLGRLENIKTETELKTIDGKV